MSECIHRFEDLRVYQEACTLDEAVFRETKSWPKEEKFALIDQIRRASRSVGANIAESWAKRRYPAHFISKLTDADGDGAQRAEMDSANALAPTRSAWPTRVPRGRRSPQLQETKHWLGRANRYGYLSQSQFDELRARAELVGRKLGKMISKPEAFG